MKSIHIANDILSISKYLIANSVLDTLPRLESVEDAKQYIKGLSRADLTVLQQKVDKLYRDRLRKYKRMKTLWHGAPKSVVKAIHDKGFQLLEGSRSGFLGMLLKVKNLAIFLSEDKRMAYAFGKNRDMSYEGSDVIQVKADIHNTLDMRRWGRNIPDELIEIGEYELEEEPEEGQYFRLIDNPVFVDAVKKAGYDSVRFKESDQVSKEFGVMNPKGDTIAVFDVKKLHIIPPKNALQILVEYSQRRRK